MANIYVRVPHYIASYLRTRIESSPLAPDEPIRMDFSDPWYIEFLMHADANLRNDVNLDCFSERQWITMRRGEAIVFKNAMIPDIARKKKDQRLHLYEIYQLAGRPDLVRRDENGTFLPDTEYPDEYVAFQMPKVIVRRGREVRVLGDWYLRSSHEFIDALRLQFKMVYVKFMAQDQYYSNALAAIGARAELTMAPGEIQRIKSRARMESIDRFMLRYDIRPGDRERETLKKMLMRAVKADALALDSDSNHSSWILAHCRNPLSETEPTQCRRVMLLETGEVYPSINACLRAVGCDTSVNNRNNLTRAIRTQGKFRGLHFTYDDVPEPVRKTRAEPDKYVLAMQKEKEQSENINIGSSNS